MRKSLFVNNILYLKVTFTDGHIGIFESSKVHSCAKMYYFDVHIESPEEQRTVYKADYQCVVNGEYISGCHDAIKGITLEKDSKFFIGILVP